MPLLNRICTADYQLPNGKKIAKGTPVVISLLGLMRDPKHFPQPEKFDPERFLAEKNNYNPSAYIPFGDGPRICIGNSNFICAAEAIIRLTKMTKNDFHFFIHILLFTGLRLGKMIAKVGIVQILQKYDFEHLGPDELEFDCHSIPLVIKGGVNLRVTKRETEINA